MADARNTNGQPPWFDLPEQDYQKQAACLSNRPDLAAAAASFRERGYLIRDFGFAESDLAAAAAYTRAIKTNRVQDAWLVNDAIGRLAASPLVLSFLSDLYRREAFPFQTLNFPRGTEQGTHSDTYFFDSVPTGFMCGVWIALEDIHPDSGPLHYYPGSQRLPVFGNRDVPGAGPDAYGAHIAGAAAASGLPRETAPIRRGQAFIWASNLFHGGQAISDPARTRLSQVTHYYFRGCSYFTPMASRDGRIFWREPFDIAGRRFVANAEPGQTPKLSLRIGQRLRIWTRRPFSS